MLLLKDLLQVRGKRILLHDRHCVTHVLWNWNQPKDHRTASEIAQLSNKLQSQQNRRKKTMWSNLKNQLKIKLFLNSQSIVVKLRKMDK